MQLFAIDNAYHPISDYVYYPISDDAYYSISVPIITACGIYGMRLLINAPKLSYLWPVVCYWYCSMFFLFSRDHSVHAPIQWETTLHCNVISHWLAVYTKLSLLQQLPYQVYRLVSTMKCFAMHENLRLRCTHILNSLVTFYQRFSFIH